MGDVNLQLLVGQDTPRSETEGNQAYFKGSKRGEACIIDFYTEMMMEGRGFQVRAGTITTPLVGDVAITDTAAELAVNAVQGLALIVVFFNLSIRLGTGTLHEYALKSIDGAAVVGTGAAFVPLPVMMETAAVSSQATAFVGAAGAVTVLAELATNTRRLWSASNPLAVGAGHSPSSYNYSPRSPHTIANNAHVYAQIAATTTGPSYYASLDYIELKWVNIS